MRVASSRFWITLLSRSVSSRTTFANASSLGSAVTAGALVSTVVAPRIEDERRAQFVRHRSDQRLAHLLGLGAPARLVDGALGGLGMLLDDCASRLATIATRVNTPNRTICSQSSVRNTGCGPSRTAR